MTRKCSKSILCIRMIWRSAGNGEKGRLHDSGDASNVRSAFNSVGTAIGSISNASSTTFNIHVDHHH